jgi:PAS domain S-box-containing protein
MEEYVWVSKLAQHPVFARAYPILQRAAQQYGVRVSIAGPDNLDVGAYVQAVYDAIQRKAAGIMVVGWEDEEIIGAIDAALASGIPVVTVESDVPNSARLAYVGTDWFRMGMGLADRLVELVAGRGAVLAIGTRGLPNVEAGFRGFQHRLAAFPDVTLIGPEGDLDVGGDGASALVADCLRCHPELNGIAAFDVGGGPGAALALKEAGLEGAVKLVCVEAEPVHLEYVRAGVIEAAFAQKREASHCLALQMLHAYRHGSVATGYHPGAINIPGNIDTGYTVVTKDNLDSFEAELGLEDALRQHELSQRLALMSSIVEHSAELALAVDLDGHIAYANPASLRLCGLGEEELLGASFDTIFDLTDGQWARVVRSVEAGQACTLEASARRKDGSAFPVHLSASPLKKGSETHGIVLIAVNISRLKQAQDEVRQQTAHLEALREVGLEISAELDLDDLLNSVVTRAVGMLGGGGGGLYLCRPERDWLQRVVSIGPDVAAGEAVVRRGQGIAGMVWQAGTHRIWGEGGHPGRPPGAPQAASGSVLGVPVEWGGDFLGVLTVSSAPESPRSFSQDDAELLGLFASPAAIAIRNARTLAVEEEQRRRAEALVEANAALTSTLELEPLLENLLTVAIRAIPAAEKGSVFLLDEETGELTARAVVGYETPRVRAVHFSAQEGYGAQAARAGRPILVPDARADRVRYEGEIDEMRAVRSAVVAPLRYRGRVIGVLSLDNASRTEAFDEDDLRLLSAFADQAAVAVENARLFLSLGEEKERLELLYRLSRHLSESLDISGVAQRALDDIRAVVGAAWGVVMVRDLEGDRLSPVAVSGGDGQAALRDLDVELCSSDGLAAWVAQRRRSALVPDVTRDERWAHVEGPDSGVHSALSVPLLSGDGLVGVLSLRSDRPAFFKDDHLQLVESAAATVAVAITNARLYQKAETERARLATLYEASRLLAGAPTLEQVAFAALQAAPYVGAQHGDLMLLDVRGEPLLYSTVPERTQFTLQEARDFVRQITTKGLEAWVLERRQSALVLDSKQDGRWLIMPGHEEEDPVRSAICVVLMDRDGEVMGLLLYTHPMPHAFGVEEHRLAEEIARRVAAALENAWLYEETQQRVQELTLLNRIAQELGGPLDVDSLIDSALQELEKLAGADRTYFIDADTAARSWEVTHERAAAGIETSIGVTGTFDDGPDALEALRDDRPFVLCEVVEGALTDTMREVYRSLDIRSTLLVPVQVRGRLYGALGFDYCLESHAWKPDEIRMLEGVAHQLELALENARLYQEARLRAEELGDALARLQELDRLKSEFIQNVSHELRSPLALIRGYAELLESGELGELESVQKGPVSIVARRSRMLSDLVDDITLILLAEARPLERQAVELGELTQAAVEDFRMAADQAGVILEAEIEPALPPVVGAPIYLRRVTDNLISNAIKFTPVAGKVTVGVRRQGDQVLFEVTDTGIGIASDQQERIFERFYQVDGSCRRRYGGVGLGLALAKEIVEGYGGRVTVSSRPGAGSAFVVWLPLAHPQE